MLDLRKIVIGLIFGALQTYSFLLFVFILEVLQIPEFTFPQVPAYFDMVIFLVSLGVFGGFIACLLLGYTLKVKRFLTGFLIVSLANLPFPILNLLSSNLEVPIYFYYLELITPFILGVLLTLFALPKEEFKPQRKILLIVSLFLLLSYAGFYNFFDTQPQELPVVTEYVVQEISEEEAITLVKEDQYPNLADFPSNNLPPKEIKSELSVDGWHLAFITYGSGIPIIEARCFLVDNGKNVIFTGDYEANSEIKNDLSIRNCK